MGERNVAWGWWVKTDPTLEHGRPVLTNGLGIEAAVAAASGPGEALHVYSPDRKAILIPLPALHALLHDHRQWLSLNGPYSDAEMAAMVAETKALVEKLGRERDERLAATPSPSALGQGQEGLEPASDLAPPVQPDTKERP